MVFFERLWSQGFRGQHLFRMEWLEKVLEAVATVSTGGDVLGYLTPTEISQKRKKAQTIIMHSKH